MTLWSPQEALDWLQARTGSLAWLAAPARVEARAGGLVASALLAPVGPTRHEDAIARAVAELRRAAEPPTTP